jgi:hypothetical protein
MKTTNNLAILLSFCFILLISCGKKQIKYEEDPKQTRLTPAMRLAGGWTLEDYTFNGNSILELLKSKKNKPPINVIVLDYSEESKDKRNPESKRFLPFWDTHLEISEHAFNVSVTDSVSNYWFTQPFHYKPIKNAVWKVTKLYQNDFNVILTTDTGTYKMFFKK